MINRNTVLNKIISYFDNCWLSAKQHVEVYVFYTYLLKGVNENVKYEKSLAQRIAFFKINFEHTRKHAVF